MLKYINIMDRQILDKLKAVPLKLKATEENGLPRK